jgi:hypothetical protein
MTVTVVQRKLLKIAKHVYFHQLGLENILIVEFPILVTKYLKLCSHMGLILWSVSGKPPQKNNAVYVCEKMDYL